MVLMHVLKTSVFRFTDKMNRIFAPKFYHDRKDTNFLKDLNYVGEKKEIDEINFSELHLLGRKLYEYRLGTNLRPKSFHPRELDWPFPNKWYQSIGFTIHGFSFEFKKAPNTIKNILNPNDSLINVENGAENADNNLMAEISFPSEKSIKEKIAKYNAIPTKSYIKESYFLYDKSNLIKKTFVTAINKQLSLYGSFSYFSGKTTVTNLKMINSSDFLKFFIEKRSLKNNISLQLLNVNGSAVKTSNKKIHNFSITKLGKKRKNSMREPIETIIIRVSKILKL